MSEEGDSSSGEGSGVWDIKARVRRHELIVGKLQIKDATRDVEIKHLVQKIDELRAAFTWVVRFVVTNLLLTAGGLILTAVIWALRNGASP